MSHRTCDVEGCDTVHYSKGWCSKHYQRMYLTGSLEIGAWQQPVSERFWGRVAKTDTCWIWQGHKDPKGYGKLGVQRRGTVRAHRLAYELEVGPIPDGMQIDHACLNKSCVRPDHLRLATPKQNCENLSANRVNNTSGVRGVSWHKRIKKWQASTHHNGKSIHLGFHEDKAEAEAIVLAKRLELFTHNELDRRVLPTHLLEITVP